MGTCERTTCRVIQTHAGAREPAVPPVPPPPEPLDLVDPAVFARSGNALSGQTGKLKNPEGHLFWNVQAGGVKGCGWFPMAFLTGR